VIFFKPARCGYTLRVTSQASYSPEYIDTNTEKSRVCKCCFKQQFGNFSKIVHVSSQNQFKPSQRKQSFGIVLSDLRDKVGFATHAQEKF
jgi:hypothetical protein